MKKLLSIIADLIAAFGTSRKLIAALRSENEQLRAAQDQETADDAERDARLRELEALNTEADEAAARVASVVNEEPVVQSVNPATFEVTSGPTQPVQDLEFRELNAEAAGKSPEVPQVESKGELESDPEEVPLESLTIAQLTHLADSEDIDLGGATKKADILAVITLAQEERSKKGGE